MLAANETKASELPEIGMVWCLGWVFSASGPPTFPVKPSIIISTDGACSPNPGCGGWAYKVTTATCQYSAKGRCESTTNNRMELQAVLEALLSLKGSAIVTIRTDSSVVIAACERNGWAYENGRKRKPPANYDIVRRIMDEMLKHEVRFEWVRGHSGDADNEAVDDMSRSESARVA